MRSWFLVFQRHAEMFVDEIRLKCLLMKSCSIPLQYPSCKNPMNSRKKQKDMTPEDKPQGQKVYNMLLGKSRRQLLIAPELLIAQRMKWLGQSGKDPQLWMCLVVKVKSGAVKNNFA